MVYSREPKCSVAYGLDCIAVGRFFPPSDFGCHGLAPLRVYRDVETHSILNIMICSSLARLRKKKNRVEMQFQIELCTTKKNPNTKLVSVNRTNLVSSS